jgi:hypothetical protein
MPGFRFSLPQASYTHSLDQGAQAVLGQVLGWLLKREVAHGWYRIALPRCMA